MTGLQKFLTSVLPKSWADNMRRESEQWKMCCPCGNQRSVWEAGGIRWGGSGNPKRLLKCPACQQMTWQETKHFPG